MNYYDHHIGDYATAVQYHSWDQDMAYTRMIRWYYAKENPLPAEHDEVCRLIGALTDLQREAVTVVLRDFFKLEPDGHHNAKCDEVIAAFHAGQPEREAKKKNEETRVERHRRERAELFAVLNAAGEHLPWNVGMPDLRAAVKRIQEAAPATAPVTAGVSGSVTAGEKSVSGGVSGGDVENSGFSSENDDSRKPATQPATAPVTPATATQYPLTTPHYPSSLKQEPTGSLSTTGKPTVAELQKQIDGIPSGLKGAYKPPECPHQKILEAFGRIIPEAIQHDTWEGQRPVNLRARWKSLACEFRWPDEATGLAYVEKFFKYIRMSPFLMGQVPPSKGHKQFELSLEFVVGAKAWQRIREGFYHGKKE